MRRAALASAAAASAAAAAAAAPAIPMWTAPVGDPKKPLGGWPVVPNASFALIFNESAAAGPVFGSYNHAAMATYGASAGDPAPLFLVTWKNGCPGCGEDKPGQKVAFSQSTDGRAWTPAAVLFPNMSTAANPAALFAEPPLWLNGRLYAAASPKQFCLYPDQYQGILLLRRVYTNGTGVLGPVFWATSPPPPAFAQASALQGVLGLEQMDAATQADVGLLTPNATHTPCDVPGGATTKCEACPGGCQPWADARNVSNERTRFAVPGGAPGADDVLLYRGDGSDARLWASVRAAPGAASFSNPVPTNISNDWSNLNAGTLPDGRVFLLSNPLPMAARDPLVVATSRDGVAFDSAAVAMSCSLLPPAGTQCYTGRTHGPSYPQGVVVPSLGALFVFATNSKKDVWVARLPLDAL